MNVHRVRQVIEFEIPDHGMDPDDVHRMLVEAAAPVRLIYRLLGAAKPPEITVTILPPDPSEADDR
jgi:hypothetical protein